MGRMSYIGLALPIAASAAAVGPSYTGWRDKPAGAPFAYAVPEGFTRQRDSGSGAARNVWTHPALGDEKLIPNVSITHVNDTGAFDDAKLSLIASGMPAYFKGTGVAWRELRHGQMKRGDGAMVGLIEGENTLGSERFRSLQLSFPDDRGASLVTANFPSAEASHWEPIFEAAIEGSRGVATRGAHKPLWVFFAWGLGAGFIALLGLAWLGGRAAGIASPA